MNTHEQTKKVKRLVAMFFAMLTVSLASVSVADEMAFGYDFAFDSQGWRYMGLYDGGGLTPVDDFLIDKNPWTQIDGNGAIGLGREGFAPLSPTGENWLHGDLNSPDLAFKVKGRGSFAFSYDITGSHMDSKATVRVQAVMVVRLPNEIFDRIYFSPFEEVPLGANGAWDTHAYSGQLPTGTVIKKINLRIFFQTSSLYWGWILVDNVVLS